MDSCRPEILQNLTNVSTDTVRKLLEQLEQDELPCKIPTFIFLALLLLVGIPGNIIVCLVYKFKFPSSPTKSFILALALFDLQVCFLGVPFEIMDLKTDYFLDIPALCKIVRFSNTLASTGSILILLLIAVYRYKKICMPFKKQITMKEVKYLFIGVGFSTVFISWPALVFYGNRTKEIHGLHTTDCSFDNMFKDQSYNQVYQVFLGVLCFIMMVLLIVLYTLIIIQIIKQKRRSRSLGARSLAPGSRLDITDDNDEKCKIKAFRMKNITPSETMTGSTPSLISETFTTIERKRPKHVKRSQTTIMMLLVTLAFIVSYMPHAALQITRQLDSSFEDRIHCSSTTLAAYRFFLRSFFFNNAINPIIYGFYNKKFRKECKHLLTRWFYSINYNEKSNSETSD